MKYYILIFSSLIIIMGTFLFLRGNTHANDIPQKGLTHEEQIEIEKNHLLESLRSKVDTAKAFCLKNDYSQDYCILIDFNIHSGKNRIFVWDFEKDTIKYSGLCCHGYGKHSTANDPVFSNAEGSYCSSLGKYKLGIRSYSSWGINVHYKMHGLEKTNNNAYKRIVVLHSHTPIPNREIYPQHLPLGYSMGCPVVSDDLMKKMDLMLKNIKKPVLLWIYN